MQNYFNYFTEIEQRFQQRRGSLLMLSTLDWALIETWREAGVPLEAVLRGIDSAFDKHDAKAVRAAAYLEENATKMVAAELRAPADGVAVEVTARLRALAVGLRAEPLTSL